MRVGDTTGKACYAGQSEIKGSNGAFKRCTDVCPDDAGHCWLGHRRRGRARISSIRDWDVVVGCCGICTGYGWLLTVWHMPDVIAQRKLFPLIPARRNN